MDAVNRPDEAIGTPRVRLVNRVMWALGLILLASAGIWFYYAVRAVRESTLASLAQCPLNQLAMAFHNYHDAHGCFPPAYVTDAAGKPMHSWRALILPYFGEEALAAEYDFSEPWNGPHNSRLADRMPRGFHSPSEPPSTSHTNYVVIVGPDTAFPGATSTRMADFKDGLDETILAAEIAHSQINWLEPRDLDVASMSFTINDPTRPSISASRRTGPYVVFAENISAHALTPALAPSTLRALTTIRGHEPLFMMETGSAAGRKGLTSPAASAATDAGLARFDGWNEVHGLWLSRSHVTDAGLVALRQAPHLYHLRLAETAITDAGLNELTRLTELYSLDVRGTRVSSDALEALKRSRPRLSITE